MAIKDWELRKKEKEEIIYWSKDSGETLNISKQDKESIYSSKSTPLWTISNSNLSVNKGFDTKSQALRFAKNYMRKY